MPFVKFLNNTAGMGELMMHRSEKIIGFMQMSEAIMRGESDLSESEREMLATYVSATNQCQYCHNSHAAVAQAYGVDEALLGEMVNNIDASSVDEKLKPLLSYAKKLTLTPYKMVQADADAVFAAGWSEEALSDAILVCAMFNMANRMIDGHGIDGNLSKEDLDKTGEMLKGKNGYMFSP